MDDQNGRLLYFFFLFDRWFDQLCKVCCYTNERKDLFLNLYRLAVVFLAFDVFFAIFCVVLACLIGIALCCCLPCIIAILYAVAGQV